MKYTTIHALTKPFLTVVVTLVVAISFATPLRAQIRSTPTNSPVQEDPSATVEEDRQVSVGFQHATLLRSRLENVREIAMQNIIVLAAQRPDEVDLTPTVPALLNIYTFDWNEQHQIMAAATLGAIGDRYGMDALYRVSEKLRYSLHHSLRTYRFAQNVVQHYRLAQMKARRMKQPGSYVADGNATKPSEMCAERSHKDGTVCLAHSK